MPKKLTIEFVREKFAEKGFELLEDVYVSNRTLMRYKCPRHPDRDNRMSYHNLHKVKGCGQCRNDDKRYSIQEVKEILLQKGCELVSDTYVDRTKPIDYRCLKHPEYIQTSTLNCIHQRQGCKYCRRDILSSIRGEQHHCWKGTQPESKRIRKTYQYLEWRLKVFERDGFTCQCCGTTKSGVFEAHHIENFSDNPNKRFDTRNGITLCKACHNPSMKGSFHNIYGTTNNDLEQLNQYFNSKGTYFKGAFSIEENLKGVFDQWQEE